MLPTHSRTELALQPAPAPATPLIPRCGCTRALKSSRGKTARACVVTSSRLHSRQTDWDQYTRWYPELGASHVPSGCFWATEQPAAWKESIRFREHVGTVFTFPTGKETSLSAYTCHFFLQQQKIPEVQGSPPQFPTEVVLYLSCWWPWLYTVIKRGLRSRQLIQATHRWVWASASLL